MLLFIFHHFLGKIKGKYFFLIYMYKEILSLKLYHIWAENISYTYLKLNDPVLLINYVILMALVICNYSRTSMARTSLGL